MGLVARRDSAACPGAGGTETLRPAAPASWVGFEGLPPLLGTCTAAVLQQLGRSRRFSSFLISWKEKKPPWAPMLKLPAPGAAGVGRSCPAACDGSRSAALSPRPGAWRGHSLSTASPREPSAGAVSSLAGGFRS